MPIRGIAFRSVSVCLGICMAMASQAPGQRAYRLESAGQLGGAAEVVAPRGDRAFLGSHEELRAYDVSSPANPSLLAKRAFTASVSGLAVDDQYVYATVRAEGRGQTALAIVDYSTDSGQLTVTGRLTTDELALANALVVEGDRAYVASTFGVRVVDISDRTQPIIIGSVADQASYAGAIARSGSHLYIIGGSGELVVVSIAVETAPSVVALLDVPGAASGIVVRGNYAYLTTFYDTLMSVVDISLPGNPSNVATVGSTGGGALPRIGSDQNLYAFTAYRTLSRFGLTDAQHPASLGTIPMDFDPYDLQFNGPLAYLAGGEDGLRIWNLATPASVGSARADVPRARALGRDGNVTIVPNGPSGISVIEGAPGSLSETIRVPATNWGLDVALHPPHAYVMGWGDRVQIIDYAVPASAHPAGEIPVPGDTALSGAVGGDRLVTAGTARVAVYNLATTPAAPALLGELDMGAGWQAFSVAFDPQGRAWAMAEAAGATILDVSGATPAVAGQYAPGRGAAISVAFAGNRAYLALGRGGLDVLDITTLPPQRLDTVPLWTTAVAVAPNGDVWCTAVYDTVYRLDPAGDYPDLLGYYQAPILPNRLSADSAGVWAAMDRAGVEVFRPASQTGTNHPPRRPHPVAPLDGATGLPLTPTLTISDFVDPDSPESPDGQVAASYFRIWNASLEDGWSSGWNNGASLSVPAGVLQPLTTYYWEGWWIDASGDFLTADSIPCRRGRFVTGDGTPPPPNHLPVARAGGDQIVASDTIAYLDGTATTDEDGDTLAYYWYQNSGPLVSIQNANTAAPTFTAPHVDVPTNLVFTLLAYDAYGFSSDDTAVMVLASDAAPNRPTILVPASGAITGLRPVLQSSAFSDSDPRDTHGATRWQVTTAGDPGFNLPLVNATATLPGNLLEYLVPPGVLAAENDYIVRVAHADDSGVFSEYSPASPFHTTATIGGGWRVR